MAKTGAITETDFNARRNQQRLTVSKWALQWKSIILSSLGRTLFPYCLYIRSLDLGNLQELLEDQIFRDQEQKSFFSDDLVDFLHTRDTPVKRQRTRKAAIKRIDIARILPQVGDSIAKFVSESAKEIGGTAELEELQGDASLPMNMLPTWVSRFSRLKSLKLWDGSILNGDVARAINTNCPNFSVLTLYYCFGGDQIDEDFSDFISGLRPQSLQTLQVTSNNELGAQAFLSLSNHSASLKELTIGNLRPGSIQDLSLLAACTALEDLNLQDNTGTVMLERDLHGIYVEILAWLTSCKKLKNIRLAHFSDGPSLLTAVCLSSAITLQSLSLVHYELVGNSAFHTSLAAQPYLETLELRADADSATRDDIDTLITSLCQLKELKDLKLLEISDFFSNAQIQQLAVSLPALEYLSIAGYGIDDSIFPALSTLYNLRSMAFHAMSSFTFTGIMSYIECLQPSNTGLQLSVMCAIEGSELTPEEQKTINEAIAAKVDGRFDFVLFREQDSDFDSLSD